jgi:hypothetical protein
MHVSMSTWNRERLEPVLKNVFLFLFLKSVLESKNRKSFFVVFSQKKKKKKGGLAYCFKKQILKTENGALGVY